MYLPTIRAGRDAQQNRVRYKNLLSQARERLSEHGMRQPDADAYLEEAETLHQNRSFWQDAADGVAAFCTADGFSAYRLPVAFDEQLSVAERPRIKPLLPALEGDIPYWLLVVSENRVRLMKGSRLALEEIDLEVLPKSLAEALQYERPEGMYLVHTGNAAIAGKQGRVYYGMGGVDSEKQDLTNYFRQIDRALAPYLRAEAHGAPLVFCGVDYLFPLYEEVNSYPQLLAEPLAGNYDHASLAELAGKAHQLLLPLVDAQETADIRRIEELNGTPRVSCAIEKILPAASDGQIEALFVAVDVGIPGVYDEAARSVQVGSEANAVDLLDLAAAETILHGGRAYASKANDVPAGLFAAALYRYSL